MTGCVAELFFWTVGSNVYIPDNITGCHVYHEKDERVSRAEHPYWYEKQIYTESRDITWSLRNKRPDKLRDTLKEVEILLSQYKCVKASWKNKVVLQIILSNGYLITYLVKQNVADIEKVLIDKSLCGKLSGEFISDALLTNSFIILSYPNLAKLDYIYFQKRSNAGDVGKKIEKVSAFDPKFGHFQIPGPSTRRVNRHLSYCSDRNLLLVWCSINPKDGCPWSPLVSDCEQANLVLLSINGPRLEVVSHVKTEYNLLNATLSQKTQQIITVELVSSRSEETTVERGTYEILKTKLQQSRSISMTLPSLFTCLSVHPSTNRLLFGCQDGTLVMFDETFMTMHSTQASLIPVNIKWHSNGAVAFVVSASGNLQLFDLALNHLNFQLLGDQFSSEKVLKTDMFFKKTIFFQDMQWNDCDNDTELSKNSQFLLLIFNKGPLAVLQLYFGLMSQEGLSVLELIKEYIKHQQLYEATNLLCSLHWENDGPSCYAGISAIANYLLRLPLNAERESYLEKTLGMFYSPVKTSIANILEYRDPICRLARRFFHLLLRYSRFEKAFLLAVDIGSEDLFMDLHYTAVDHNETSLAEVSKKKAEEIQELGINSSEEEESSESDYHSDYYQNPLQSYHPSNSDFVEKVMHHPKIKKSPSLQERCPSRVPKLRLRHRTENTDKESTVDYFHSATSFQPSENYHDAIGKELVNELIQDYTDALLDKPTIDVDGTSHVFTYL
ncbi:repeat-containing and planar cell polarity effector fritz homolog [Octopus vulgaris]|uniref:Repeat-containing and planar cell polarity effector fritz homolog n=1 Tax=Octopus vulgaris TaxID=6645 RepID=A0AA36F5X2_OCTVU|nr:repeat-containing and planar cell polarity effector fritz homolog [Octopus vulgaris]